MGGGYGDRIRESGDGDRIPSRCRYVPITESPNSDQYRRAEYLKAWWGVMNWDKALADFN